MPITVRPIGHDERAAWEPLWDAYLEFYETSAAPGVTDAAWMRIHDPEESMFALGAYDGDRLIGIAHYLFHRSFWTVSDYCYLQDLFVSPQARGTGAARALIAAVEQAARMAGVNRVHWLTKEDNHAARALYDKVAQRSGFIQYRKLL